MRLFNATDRLSELAPVLVDAAIRGAAVLLVALVLTHLLRRRNAAARHLIWVGAIVVQLLLPVFALWGPKWNVAIPKFVSAVVHADSSTPASPPLGMTSAPRATPAPSVTVVSASSTEELPPAPAFTVPQLLIAVWAMGALVILARLAIGTAFVARLARKGNRIDDGNWLALAQRVSGALGIARPLTLLRGPSLGVPMTWGIVYPIVLLPEDANAWSEERRRFVLVHEMAHVKRLDALTQLAGQFALALFWFDPLVWIANRRMQMEREHACDDYVIRQGTAPSTYAEELLTMVRALGQQRRGEQPAFAALAMARRSEFEGRMLSILDPLLDRHPLSRARTLMSTLFALVLVVPLAALHPYQKTDVTPRATTRIPDEFPESFKVSITPSGTKVTPAPASEPGAPVPPPVQQATSGGTIVTYSGTAAQSCDNVSGSNASTTHVHADTDQHTAGGVLVTYFAFNDAMCATATIVGKLQYSAEEDDIIAMPAGSSATFRERRDGLDREVIWREPPLIIVDGAAISPDAKASARYVRNGVTVPYDAEARAWFAEFLPKVLMETGLNIAPRIARWRGQGGVDKALSRIEHIASSNAKRMHYEALLDARDLSADDIDRVVRSAGASLTGSSSDMRAVLMHAAPRGRVSKETIPALERAMTSMKSSGDRALLVQTYGQTDDRDMLLAVMRVTGTMPSSGDRSRVLQVLTSRYLTKNDRDLEDAYFGIVDGLPSSSDRRDVLHLATPYAGATTVAAHVIASVRKMPSSSDQSSVLIRLASSGALVNKSLRDEFFAAAAAIGSTDERSRVLQAGAAIRP